MKKNKYIGISLTIIIFIQFSCTKTLQEKPQSILTPAFLKTAQGLQSGLDAAYAGNRDIYGPENFFALTVGGTDEFTAGSDAGSNGNLFRYNSSFNSTTTTISAVWNYCYTFINACNGVVDNAPGVPGVTPAVQNAAIAEAKFLRANYYFILVQLFGDVTLNTQFSTAPSTSASRTPIAQVYNFIIQDLNDAIKGLPASPKTSGVLPGKASQAAAMHLLAKVYLTRAGSTAKQTTDYQNAYNTAINLIGTLAPANGLSLQQDFANVFAEGNETNSEVLWTVQHTATLAYNGPGGYVDGDNALCHFFVPKYDSQPGMQRSVVYGRPFTRVMPTHWLTDIAFKERINDTRYSKTFLTTWISNNAASIPKINNVPKYAVGDTAIDLPGYEVSAAYIASKPYQVIPPSKYTNLFFPSLKKFYDSKRTNVALPSIRPIIVYRLSETYLIAAEALFMDGKSDQALQYLNAVRERAAYPTGNPKLMDAQLSDLSADYILDERARELCGEQMRWFDLVRTGKLLSRLQAYNPDAAPNITSKDVFTANSSEPNRCNYNRAKIPAKSGVVTYNYMDLNCPVKMFDIEFLKIF